MATRGALHSVVFPVCLCASVLLFLFLFFFSLFFVFLFLSFFSLAACFFAFVFLSVGPSLEASARLARLLLAGVVVPTCCLVVPFLFCSVPDRSFSWGCWGRLCFSQWSPRLVRAHRFLAASLGPGEQWRGPHVAPVASVPPGDAGRFRYLWGLGSGR